MIKNSYSKTVWLLALVLLLIPNIFLCGSASASGGWTQVADGIKTFGGGSSVTSAMVMHNRALYVAATGHDGAKVLKYLYVGVMNSGPTGCEIWRYEKNGSTVVNPKILKRNRVTGPGYRDALVKIPLSRSGVPAKRVPAEKSLYPAIDGLRRLN